MDFLDDIPDDEEVFEDVIADDPCAIEMDYWPCDEEED